MWTFLSSSSLREASSLSEGSIVSDRKDGIIYHNFLEVFLELEKSMKIHNHNGRWISWKRRAIFFLSKMKIFESF